MIASQRFFQQLAGIAAAAAACIGVLALVGWANGIETLTGVLPSLSTLKPNTALCLIACGLALICIAARPKDRIAVIAARVLAGGALLLALLSLAEFVFGWNLRIDQALFVDFGDPVHAGRMGANTAAALALVATAIMTVGSGADIVVLRAQLLTIGATIIALFSLVGYVYSATYLYQVVSATPMAINTAVALMLLCAAVMWVKPDQAMMRAVHRADGAGLTMRRLIPAAIVVPIGIGWLRLLGERAGLYDATYGVSLFTLSAITIFVLLIVVNAKGVRKLEETRERAQADLQQALLSVEQRVAERTQELHEALSSLADSENRLERATEGSNSGILDLDVAAQTVRCSRRWNEMLGRDGDAPLTVAEFMRLVHPDDRKAAMTALVDHFKGVASNFSVEVRMSHVDGSYRWMLSRGQAVRDASGQAVRMLGSQTDITEIKQLQEQLRDASIRDAVTGLYNRTHFIERLTAATRLSMRHGLPLSFCMFDIDRFKQINDAYGHQAGDDVIKAIGTAVAAEIRAEDVGARYGGDEFCIMFEGSPATAAAACLGRIKARIENTPFFASDGRRFSATMSFGVSELGGRSVPELIEAADRALYEAKSQGRSKIVVERPSAATPIRKKA